MIQVIPKLDHNSRSHLFITLVLTAHNIRCAYPLCTQERCRIAAGGRRSLLPFSGRLQEFRTLLTGDSALQTLNKRDRLRFLFGCEDKVQITYCYCLIDFQYLNLITVSLTFVMVTKMTSYPSHVSFRLNFLVN